VEPDGTNDADNPNEGRQQTEAEEIVLEQEPVSHEGPATVATVRALIPRAFG
jgi:hypothetical protein